ncbi:MAG: restriction endonuclease subunit S [Saccharofermentanales bacterium]|jgi:type I restriction enzyme S subunit
MKWVKLGKIAEINMGVSPNSEYYNDKGEGIPFYQGIADFGELYPTANVYTTEPKKIANKDEILIGVRAPVGKMNFISEKSCIGRGLAAINSKKSDVSNKYLFYFLQTQMDYFEKNSTGSTFKAINKKVLEDTPVIYFDEDLNNHIVNILDQTLHLISTRQAQIEAMDELIQSVFHEMFGDQKSNNSMVKLTKIARVGSSSRVYKADFKTEGIPFFRGQEINLLSSQQFDKPELFISQELYRELIAKSGKPKTGDLLLASVNPEGKIWIVNTDKNFYFKDGRVLWISFNENIEKNSIYFRFAIHEKIKRDYTKIASGSTFRELKIFELKNIEIPLPPLELQNQFADKVKAIEKQKAIMQKSLKEMQTLFDALMQKAFSGGLRNI